MLSMHSWPPMTFPPPCREQLPLQLLLSCFKLDLTDGMQLEHIHTRREIEAGERSNLIIAVGDLALRFPNLLEPWTAHIYQPLSDPDTGAPRLAP